ncbi:MAG TPA: hypothetical protein VGO59_00730 [Verrucomicrobiae bacterium]|jgi:hypothetical protein
MNLMDAWTQKTTSIAGRPSVDRIVVALCGIFLICGPAGAMCLSLLFLSWLFTLAELNPKTKKSAAFNARLFQLPMTTPFLFWWFFLAGQAVIALAYWCWVYLVPQPRLDIFQPCQSCLAWMTVVALAQGVTWTLAAWPATRALLLCGILYGFLLTPAQPAIARSLWVLVPLYMTGIALGYAGLRKMRHGQWQGINWEKLFRTLVPSRELRGPKKFASPAQAQLWFEWHRFARVACFAVGALALVPVAVHVALRYGMGWGPLQNDTLFIFVFCLVALPLILHLLCGFSPQQNDMPFMLNRPAANGQIMMARLKAAAISTLISWALVSLALAAMPLLGDFKEAAKAWKMSDVRWPILILPLALLTWRIIAVNLCFVWSGSRRLRGMPALLFMGSYAGTLLCVALRGYQPAWEIISRSLPAVLICLAGIKFVLAFFAFRTSIKRGLLAISAASGYLAVWVLMAAALVIPALAWFHNEPGIFSVCLLIILLTPLARIGFCPIAMTWERHA